MTPDYDTFLDSGRGGPNDDPPPCELSEYRAAKRANAELHVISMKGLPSALWSSMCEVLTSFEDWLCDMEDAGMTDPGEPDEEDGE